MRVNLRMSAWLSNSVDLERLRTRLGESVNLERLHTKLGFFGDGLIGLCLFAALVAVFLYICTFGARRFAKIDWREDCWCVGKLGTVLGETPSFNLNVLVHKSEGFTSSHAFAVQVKVGPETQSTNFSKTGAWDQELRVRVKQGLTRLKIFVLEKGEVIHKHKSIGTATIDIQKDLLEYLDDSELGGVVAQKWYTITNSRGSSKGQIQVSFSRRSFLADTAPLLEARGLDTEKLSGPLSGLLANSTKRLQRDSVCLSKPPGQSQHETIRQKLRILAGAVEGPVQKVGSLGRSSKCYFKAYLDRSPEGTSQWVFGVWDNDDGHGKERAQTEEPRKSIPVLRVTRVYADKKAEGFVIRYQVKGRDILGNDQRKELILKRVDREIETWVEALQLFISELREGLKAHMAMSTDSTKAAKLDQIVEVSDSSEPPDGRAKDRPQCGSSSSRRAPE